MLNDKKLVVSVPEKLHEKMNLARDKQMISKSALVKLAVNQYCDCVLNKNSAGETNGTNQTS